MWDRTAQQDIVDTSGVFGTGVQAILFDPTAVIPGNQDLRLTVKSIRFAAGFKAVFTAGANIALLAYFGVYVGASTELRDPSFATAGDERTDWLWRAVVPFSPGAAAITFISGPGLTAQNSLDGEDLCRVRVKRKIDQDQQVLLALTLKRLDPAVDAAPTISRQVLWCSASTLYSRTMR